MNVLLKGVTGSTAYGLNHDGSDVDYMGVFAEPTDVIVGLDRPKKESVSTKDPDTIMHEARKFAALCLEGNPSVSELLWLGMYEVITELGDELVNLRRSFLSAHRVRNAYLGYATSQFHRLLNREDGSFSSDTRKRTEKHARHLVRLVEQGFYLYLTGELVVNLRSNASEVDPDWVFSMGRKIADDPEVARRYMVESEERFDRVSSPLPDGPDRDLVNRWLIRVRRADWGLEQNG